MRAAVAASQHPDDPLRGLKLVERPEPQPRPGWTRIHVRGASLNPHDVWTLRGVGHPADRIPIVLGCDAAGVTDDGREVVVHPIIADALRGGGDQTLDPQRALLSETIDGALADVLLVPDELVLPKPTGLDFVQAASLGVTWGTAFRMLFTRGRVGPGDRVLVQGGSGGVGSAAIALAAAAGAVVTATARSGAKRDYVASLGAHTVIAPGERVPERVDVVIETVGEATWAHSLRALRPGGAIVVAGATTGAMPPADLQRVFFQQLSVIGSTGCTRSEFEAMLRFVASAGLTPRVEAIAFDEIPDGYRRLIAGDVLGKLAVDMTR